MLLTGTFQRSVDGKQRIAIPKLIRDAFQTSSGCVLYVAPGTDDSLALFPEGSFAQLAERLGQASPNSREVRDYTRLFYARASRVELDAQGRIRIPQELADLISLGKDAVLLGVCDHLELWDKEHWDAYLAQKQGSYDEIAEGAFAGPGASLPATIEPPVVRNPK